MPVFVTRCVTMYVDLGNYLGPRRIVGDLRFESPIAKPEST